MDIDEVKDIGNNLPDNLPNKVSTPGGGANPDLEIADPTKGKKPDVVGPNNDGEISNPNETDVMDPENEDVLNPEDDKNSATKKKKEKEEPKEEGETEDVLDPEAEKDEKKKDKEKEEKDKEKEKKEEENSDGDGKSKDSSDGSESSSESGDASSNNNVDTTGDTAQPNANAGGQTPGETGGLNNTGGSGSAPELGTGGTPGGAPGGTPGAAPTAAPTAAPGGAVAGAEGAAVGAEGAAAGAAGSAGGAAGAAGGAAGGGSAGIFANPYVLLVIVIIIVIIGLIGFILNMPGLLIGKLKQIAQDVWDNIEALFTTGANAFINDDDVTELAQYLVDMDYDLIGYGFVRAKIEDDYDTFLDLEEDGYFMNDEGIYVKTDDAGNETKYSGKYYNSAGKLIDNSTGQYYVVDDDFTKDKYGIRYWAKDTEKDGKTYTKGNIAEVYDSGSDVFVGSDATGDDKLLRAYLMSDYRIGFLRNDDEGLLDKIGDAVKKTFGGTPNAWTKGLIKLYKREGETVSTFWDGISTFWWNDVSIKDNGTVLSARKEWLNQPMEYQLDGWTGRYGLSLEFLLSLHLGTMAPDLVYAMLENFDTEVQVYMQSVDNAEVETRYLEKDSATDEVTVDEIEEVLDENIFEGTLTEILNNLSISKADCLKLLHADIGLESQNNCTHYYHFEVVEKATQDTENFLWWDTSNNPLEDYNLEDPDVIGYLNEVQDDYANYIDEDGNKFDLAHCVKDLLGDDSYIEVIKPNGDDKGYTKTYFSDNDLAEFGYDPNNLEVEDYNVIIDKKRIKNVDRVTWDVDTEVRHTYEVTLVETTKEWTKKDFVDTSGTTQAEQWFEFKSYKLILRIVEQEVWEQDWHGPVYYTWYLDHTNNAETRPDVYPYTDHIYLWEFVVRDKTWEELENEGMIEDGKIKNADDSTCSTDKSTEKCCTNCKNYVTNVIRAMAEVNDEDYAYFQPYIARVIGSWFRDTYFIIPTAKDKGIEDYEDSHPEWDSTGSYGANNTYIKVDEDYLYATNEYWTDYEMKTETLADGTVVETDEYQLYYLNPNGTTSNTTLEQWLETEHPLRNSTETKKFANQEDAEKEGYVFVKKAKMLTLDEIKENVNKDEGGGRDLSEAPYMKGTAWSAYTLGDGGSSGWIEIQPQESNKFVRKVKEINPDGKFEYQLLSTVSVEQEEDAIRTETNVTIKNLFRYRQYYIFDGSTARAEAIQADREKVIDLVKSYINDEYSKSSAISDLRQYGRQALRTTYGSTTITGTVDTEAVAEAWLEWQLDMYYRADNEKGLSDAEKERFKLDEICTYGINHTYTNPEGEEVTYLDKEYYTSSNHSLDPRDRNLISTVNITKSSLDAFSILENVNTLDADYQYRDFKELIVELNYFDKEDLSEAIEEVFTWISPNYTSVWPLIATDKQNNEYGTLVHSQASVDFLIKVYEKLVQEEEALAGEPEVPEGAPEDDEEEEEQLNDVQTTLELLKGVVSYSENDAIISPATGKIIAYGEHDRINVYTQEKEKVGYVKIQVMSYGKDDKQISKSYFTTSMMPSSLSDEEKEEAVTGLNSFYDEYKDQCAGYILMIDGIDISDLKAGFTGLTDAEGNAVEYDTLCKYETQDSMALYNSKEQEKRDKENEAKTNAPYFISYNANYTEVNGEYLAQDELGGYYVKEGAYLGKAQSPTDRTGIKYEVNAGVQKPNPNIENPDALVDENPEKTVDMQKVYDEFLDETKNPDYLRLILLDKELTVVDNVEDYFPGFQEENGTNGRGIYKDLEQIDENSSYEDKIRAAMSYFVAQGFTNEGAAGIVGNMMAESSMDPKADNGIGYHGLCQWNTNYGWWDQICDWTSAQGYNMYDFAGQVRAVYESPNRGGMTDERWEELQTMVNVQRAAELFCVFYEAPVGGTDAPTWYGKGELYQGLVRRKEYAQQALDIYLGNDVESE